MNVIIVGAGHAGFQCAASLRQEGFKGDILLVGDEPSLPYQRPPLSKAYLLGKVSATDLLFRPPHFYEDHRIRRVHSRVERIDPQARRVVLQSGESIGYQHLVLATGARPRHLPIPGANLDGVFGLQTLEHADALRQWVVPGRRAVVIGAGFIGLEFAAAARTLGLDVTVVDVADRALARAASAHCAEVIVASHKRRGIQFRFSCAVAGLEGAQGKVTAVRTADGDALAADLVVVGIGVDPRTQLALQAGLRVDNGIVVDAQLVTSDPNISAIGDAAAFPERVSGRRIRLESVQNATDQARAVAARLTGKHAVYSAVPWFWSDQGDLKLQIAGLRTPDDDHVVLADPATRGRTVLCIRRGQLAAIETIDRPADHMLARRLLARDVHVTPEEARQPGFQLKSLS